MMQRIDFCDDGVTRGRELGPAKQSGAVEDYVAAVLKIHYVQRSTAVPLGRTDRWVDCECHPAADYRRHPIADDVDVPRNAGGAEVVNHGGAAARQICR